MKKKREIRGQFRSGVDEVLQNYRVTVECVGQ